ncbi:hypothetical protein TWF569_004108 [Orbilia oligospora]|uniref:Calcium binding protein 39 n=3 Tax=Orbilia oligospora TaxID=2813651 RepID=G1XLZ6_ARTOA|nr:hypothetical protein AOL_s00117g43 [Orbilia oligospora ATCC 24927]KAF3086573.1 hypothetical protein TWF102_010979 [Orbilia oligospora]EGX45838.1 hypothetical protein AOL_s00117g43 [Orbilia oligospora ATCC 24927]KAF3103895.1 hypothetical protein TWF103_007049 [Orbilia oligospora]KAF3125958.1 hypothetical protein TWF703_010604 [Orbilia oligospora]KAF3129755.1 hypothetical protein TWF594_010876 [Orbilia oligospora]
MSFLFGRSKDKGPGEAVRRLREHLLKLDQPGARRTAQEEAGKQLRLIRNELAPVPGDENNDNIFAIAQEACALDLFPILAICLPKLDFEARKDSTTILNALLRYNVQNAQICVLYLAGRHQGGHRPDAILTLVNAYNDAETSSNSGQILKEAFKYEPLARIALYDPSFWNFFTYVQGGRFDTSSDAFTTFKELLTRHKVLVAEFLASHYDEFFTQYNALLTSDNYITKRQSIKLLGEILLDRANYNIMTAYVDSPDHLKLCMNLLRDKSKNVQYEAFHVFKVFVANPKKSKPVESLLIKNREQLLRFLPKFHEDRKDDEQFNDEKAFLLKQIEMLGQPPGFPQQI